MKKLLVFDANSVVNRAFYAVRDLSTSAGLHTNALYGFVNILKKHLDAQAPDFCVCAFDLRAPTFRHKRYDGYKATRKPMPAELAEQMPYARRLARLLGLCVVEIEGFEADDILGAASRQAEDAGVQSVLVTGDRDSFQLVSEKTSVLLATTGADVLYTPQKILETYTLTPPQLIDVKALAGDHSDNIPGVRGIGEKGAISLISQAGSLENLYADPSRFALTPSLSQKLAQGKEDAFLSYELAKIIREIPGMPPLSELKRNNPDREGLAALFTELEFSRLFHSFGLEAPPAPLPEKKAPKKASNPAQVSLGGAPDGQLSLGDAPEERELAEEIAVGIPTPAKSGEALFCLFDNGTLYCRSASETLALPAADARAFCEERSPVVFDAKLYYHGCAALGADPEHCSASFDLALAAYLLDPTGASPTLTRSSIAFLAKPVSPDAPISERLLLCEQLYAVLAQKLRDEGLFELCQETELPLAKILCEMELCGFLLDRDGLLAYGQVLKERIGEIEARIYTAAGEPLNLNSPQQLGKLLFDKLGLPHARKNKTGFSTDAETLEKLRFLSPVVEDILEYRKLSKLCGTYVEGLSREADENGRVHTTFLQMQTITGRLSSMEPNLQNIPVRTEEGRQLRRFFVASPGMVLVDADYSQVELRILAHLSGDEGLLHAFANGEDIHTRTASEVFHIPQNEVTPEQRKSAKAINFGIVYGIGDYSLSQDLHITRAMAQEYMEHYFACYPKVKRYLEQTVEEARQSGYVRTMFGRRRFVSELQSDKKQLRAFGERVAMNTPIQGTAADIMKRAMVNVAARLKREKLGAHLLLQIHDELVLECDAAEKERTMTLLREEMEGAAQLQTTLIAEAGTGQNLLEAKL